MPDIIIDFSDYQNYSKNERSESLCRILEIASRENVREVMFCHNWLNPLDITEKAEKMILAGKFKLSIHTNSPESINENENEMLKKKYSQVICKISTLLKNDPEVKENLGSFNEITSYVPIDFSGYNPGYIDELKSFQNLKSFILGYSSDYLADNETAPREQGILFDRIISQLGFLSQTGRIFETECGMSLCTFTREELAKIAKYRMCWPAFRCSALPVISLSGHADFCHKIKSPDSINVFKSNSISEARSATIKHVSPFMSFCDGVSPENCRSGKTGACGGGCKKSVLCGWSGF